MICYIKLFKILKKFYKMIKSFGSIFKTEVLKNSAFYKNDEKPIIYKENYHANGQLKSIYQYIDHSNQKINKRILLIPIWQLVLALLYLLSIMLILLAGLVLAFKNPQPGLYDQSCASRSCTKGLKLKCINKTCQCESTQYYSKGCIYKKTLMEKCSSVISNCQDNKNLVCIDGFCKCNETFFWNGVKCVAKGKYLTSCNNDAVCLSELMLTCDSKTKQCNCDSLRYCYF